MNCDNCCNVREVSKGRHGEKEMLAPMVRNLHVEIARGLKVVFQEPVPCAENAVKVMDLLREVVANLVQIVRAKVAEKAVRIVRVRVDESQAPTVLVKVAANRVPIVHEKVAAKQGLIVPEKAHVAKLLQNECEKLQSKLKWRGKESNAPNPSRKKKLPRQKTNNSRAINNS